jgi:hypothetical protein
MSDQLTPTKVAPLAAEQAAALDRDGYLLLRGAVPMAAALCAAFDAGEGTPDQWAAPRGTSAGAMPWSTWIPRCGRPVACRPCWRRRGGSWAVPFSSVRSRVASRCRTAAIRASEDA